MARQPETHPIDEVIANYVDSLETNRPAIKDNDMEIRQLEELADRLHNLSGSYPAEVTVTTRQRMEVFSAYRQNNQQAQPRQGLLERMLESLGRYPTVTAIGMVAVLVLAVVTVVSNSPTGSGFSATAGLGNLLVPVIAFGLLLVAAVIYSIKRRK